MSEPPRVNPWIVAISVMFATFMQVRDTTVMNVSLHHIAGRLSASIDEATWALTSYLVANAIVLPMTGWLASVFGRKRLLMASVAGFTVSSFLCGLAPNLSMLIVFRILQGATGGAMQPLSQAVLLEAFPPQDRGKAMGFWGLGIVVAPILGPVLGGWLTDSYSWRGVFLMTVVGFVLYGSLVLLPIMLQTLLGYPSLQAGIAMAPRGIGSFFMMPLTGLMTGRFDPRKLLTVGLIVGGVTLLWLSELNLNAGYWDIFWPQLVQGVGMSMLFVPLTTVTMDPIPRERMGNATSLFNLMRNIGGSIGIAVTGTMLARHQQTTTTLLGANVTPYSATAQSMFERMRAGFIATGSDAVTATNRAYAAMYGLVQRQAAMVSFVSIFQLLGLLFLALIPLILI